MIPVENLKEIITHTNQFNPKELNILLRHLDGDLFEYKTFGQQLFDIRFELLKSRINDTNIEKIEEHL